MEPIELRSPWPAATVLGAPPVPVALINHGPRGPLPPAICDNPLHNVIFHRCGWPGAAPARTARPRGDRTRSTPGPRPRGATRPLGPAPV